MPILPLLVVVLGTAVDPQASVRPAVTLGDLASRPLADEMDAARRALDERAFGRAALLAAMASARAPSAVEPALVLGLARFRAGEPRLAIAPFAHAVAAAPASATARFDLASALYQSGRFADAERGYVEAARLDGKIAALARYDAALAAVDGGDAERARTHLSAAIEAARAAGQDALVAEAEALRASLAPRPSDGVSPAIRALAHAAKAALLARRYGEAVDGYRRARDAAEAAGASAADRAELEYALGHSLFREGDLVAAARALEAAIRLAPAEAEFPYLLGLVHFDAGADHDAELALTQSLALGLAGDEANHARDLLRSLQQPRPGDSSRFFVELRVAGGYDSNVPQSGVVVTATSGNSAGESAAFLLEAAADFFWRPAGTSRNGFSLEYRFDQLAYLSSLLDPYSLQEHDLTLAGAWTPTPRLTLELGGDGFLLFSGVQTFSPFEAGASVGPRIIVREPHGFETRLRYQHIFKLALDPQYAYLAGNRDEAAIAEHWRDAKDRLTLGYQLAREAVGTERISLGNLYLPAAAPGSYSANDVYTIPYSYLGHEVSFSFTRNLAYAFRGVLSLRYEHRSYDNASFITTTTQPLTNFDRRKRIDDRFGGDLSLRRAIGRGFELEATYDLIVNLSTIDNTRPSTPLDYDDKNYFKHVVQLDLLWTY